MSSSSTVCLQGSGELFINSSSGNWYGDFATISLLPSDWSKLWIKYGPVSILNIPVASAIKTSMTAVTDTTSTSQYKEKLDIRDLHWTAVETLETYLRLKPFEEDWNAPGMEGYDAL